jgi:hypothetical protein
MTIGITETLESAEELCTKFGNDVVGMDVFFDYLCVVSPVTDTFVRIDELA